MFCYQCEQTYRMTGCTDKGVCGKDEPTAALQDLLIAQVKEIARYAHRARGFGAFDRSIDRTIVEILFTTVTNVNFDPARLQKIVETGDKTKNAARDLYENACRAAGQEPENLSLASDLIPASTLEGLVQQGQAESITARTELNGADITGLQELILYGVKGAASYAFHATVLGKEDDSFYASVVETLNFLTLPNPPVDALLAKALETGAINMQAMELLDAANTEAFGHPEPTRVRTEPVKGKAIVVSGHDLEDLYELLKQTEGKGINIYTHGEMLPAHGYPKLRAFSHLKGNYGGAWMNQGVEFDKLPGAVLMTTNCIQEPRDTYKERIFSCGLVAWPGVQHIADKDFTPVIEAALAAPGFEEDGPDNYTMTGFARNAVLGVADKVVDAVKSGAIRHFFLIGGCDGAKPGRNYYADLAESVPDDCVILTLACGKYRFNKKQFGDIGGIPRLLDIGQCNDAYSAIQIAVALSKAFGCGVNDLPLSLVLSWYEQKAVAILLTLLHLGIKNIRLGPSLPAFLTPNAVQVLVDTFELKPVTTVEEDLDAILGAVPVTK